MAYDQDAMLEFHYEEQGHCSNPGERKHESKHQLQRVPGHAKNFDFGGIETAAAIPSLTEQASLPVTSASSAVQSLWSTGNKEYM